MSTRTVLLALLAAASCGPGEPPDERPDVLVVAADDLAWTAVESFGGWRGLTPAIDRLAEGGASFRKALCAATLCTPSRQALLTGRWPHSTGVTRLGSMLPADSVTLATTFRDAGYETAAIGKMHWNRRGADHDYGFEQILERRDWREGLSADELGKIEAHADRWAASWNDARSRYRAEPLDLPGERLEAAWIVDRTIELLDRERERPLLAFCSLSQPHYPFVYPASMEAGVDTSGLALPDFDHQRLRANVPGLSPSLPGGGVLDAESGLALRTAYARSVAWLDAQIARLLDHLDRTGLAERTVVVFWSDHGYLTGERGLVGKKAAFDEVVRVPLVVRDPRRAAATCDRPVSLIDVFPTLCELADVPAPDGLEGSSLVAAMDGEAPARDYAFCELPGVWGLVQTNDWKVVVGARRELGLDQLYDLRSDPGEERNLFGRGHEDRVVELVEAMHATLEATRPTEVAEEDWMNRTTRLASVRAALRHAEAEDDLGSGSEEN